MKTLSRRSFIKLTAIGVSSIFIPFNAIKQKSIAFAGNVKNKSKACFMKIGRKFFHLGDKKDYLHWNGKTLKIKGKVDK